MLIVVINISWDQFAMIIWWCRSCVCGLYMDKITRWHNKYTHKRQIPSWKTFVNEEHTEYLLLTENSWMEVKCVICQKRQRRRKRPKRRRRIQTEQRLINETIKWIKTRSLFLANIVCVDGWTDGRWGCEWDCGQVQMCIPLSIIKQLLMIIATELPS